jgi:hypothetical protein
MLNSLQVANTPFYMVPTVAPPRSPVTLRDDEFDSQVWRLIRIG